MTIPLRKEGRKLKEIPLGSTASSERGSSPLITNASDAERIFGFVDDETHSSFLFFIDVLSSELTACLKISSEPGLVPGEI